MFTGETQWRNLRATSNSIRVKCLGREQMVFGSFPGKVFWPYHSEHYSCFREANTFCSSRFVARRFVFEGVQNERRRVRYFGKRVPRGVACFHETRNVSCSVRVIRSIVVYRCARFTQWHACLCTLRILPWCSSTYV